MIYGIGTDIVRVERIRDVVVRWGDRFLRKVFTEDEISYCFKKRNPFPSLSVRFAAKEAMIKALGARSSLDFRDIETINDENGRPEIRVKGRLEKVFMNHALRKAHLSLSHEKEYGVALVVLET